MSLFKENEKYYGEINLKFDSTVKGEKQQQIVRGDETTISALVGALIHNLLEGGFDRELLTHAIEEGLNKSKNKKIFVKEMKFDSKEEMDKFLEKLMREVKE